MEEEKQKDKEEKKKGDAPIVSLADVYTSRDKLNLFIINKNKTRLKHILSNDIKDVENEVCLLDVLKGNIQSGIDNSIINDLREYFKINRQIGYNPTTMYDFQFKVDGNKLYKLSLFANIQKSNDASEDFRNF